MDNKSTKYLDDILKNSKLDEIQDFLNNNQKAFIKNKKEFSFYFKDVLLTKGIMLKDLYSFAGYKESYASKIINMEKHTKDRDVIIRFCLAGRFTQKETNKALKLYGFNELYSKDNRDAVIAIAINNGVYDFATIDDLLEKYNLRILSRPEEKI